MSSLQLTIVSQEKALVRTGAQRLTVPGCEGELTILPGHIPLITRLSPGQLEYVSEGKVHFLAVSRGFLTVSAGNEVIIMVDSAVEAREISTQKAQEAIEKAKQTIQLSENQREKLKAEAELRFALLQLKLAEKTKKS
jgi:F-type H+-transporting ATPase subunit epsilon